MAITHPRTFPRLSSCLPPLRYLPIIGVLILSCDPDAGDSFSSGGKPSEFMAGDTLVKLAGAPIHPGVASLQLELTIGLIEGPLEYSLSGVPELLPLPDGSVLVHDNPARGEPSLRHYGGEGQFLGYFGRTGGGPGEFRQPTGLARLPDGRVLFGDTRMGRINVYDSVRAVLDTWTLGSSYPTIGNSRGALIADPTGTVYLFWAGRPTGDPRSDDRFTFLRLRSDGSIIDTIPLPTLPEFPVAGNARKVRRTESGGTSTVGFAVPYYPRYTRDLSPLGYFVTGRTDQYAIDLRIPEGISSGTRAAAPTWREGDPVISIRRNVEPVRVSREEGKDQLDYVQARLDRAEGQLEGPIPPVPEEKPFFKGIQFDQSGRIWVSISTPSVKTTPDPQQVAEANGWRLIGWSEPTLFDVFEPDGTFVGQVAIPDDVWVMAVAGDIVWAVTHDDFDVPYVQKYRIAWE